MINAVGNEAGKNHCRITVNRSVSEVVFPGPAKRRVNDEFARHRVIGGGRANASDIRTVAGFGHRESAHNVELHDAGKQLIVVSFRAQMKYGRAK